MTVSALFWKASPDKRVIREYEWDPEANSRAGGELYKGQQLLGLGIPREGLPIGIAWTSRVHPHPWGSAPQGAQVTLPDRELSCAQISLVA